MWRAHGTALRWGETVHMTTVTLVHLPLPVHLLVTRRTIIVGTTCLM
jgi:hypothetical protein